MGVNAYHPPSTDGYTDVLRWFLVAVPDKPEYVRAAEGAYTDLAHTWKWDGNVGSTQDAADSFALAIAATLEALEMGFPDVLLGHIDEVEDLLRQIASASGGAVCCPDVPGADTVVSDVPNNLETSDTDVGLGTFPGGMTAGEFDTYLCAAATAYVDELIELPDTALETFQQVFAAIVTMIVIFTTGAYIGLAGAIGGVLTLAGILNIIGVLEDIIAGISAGTEDDPSVPSTELLAAKDDLVCAIYTANDADAAATALRSEIQNAVGSTGWENLLLLWPHETLLAKVFNGDADGAPAATCTCVPALSSKSYTFDTDAEGWTRENTGNPVVHQPSTSPLPPSGTATIQFEQFDDYMRSPDFNLIGFNEVSWDAVFYNYHSSGTVVAIGLYRSSDNALIQASQLNGAAGVWVTKNYDNIPVGNQTEQNYHLRVTSSNRGGRLDSCTVTVAQV